MKTRVMWTPEMDTYLRTNFPKFLKGEIGVREFRKNVGGATMSAIRTRFYRPPGSKPTRAVTNGVSKKYPNFVKSIAARLAAKGLSATEIDEVILGQDLTQTQLAQIARTYRANGGVVVRNIAGEVRITPLRGSADN